MISYKIFGWCLKYHPKCRAWESFPPCCIIFPAKELFMCSLMAAKVFSWNIKFSNNSFCPWTTTFKQCRTIIPTEFLVDVWKIIQSVGPGKVFLLAPSSSRLKSLSCVRWWQRKFSFRHRLSWLEAAAAAEMLPHIEIRIPIWFQN